MFENLSKADLHVHLNGAIPFETIDYLVQTENIVIPTDFEYPKDLFIDKPVANLNTYFKPWNLLRLLPTNKVNFDLIIASTLQSLSKDNVRYVELRNSIIYIAELNKISIEETIDWHIEALDQFSELYNIDARLLISVRREMNQITIYNTILAYVQSLKSNRIVGFDLTGNETHLVLDGLSRFFSKVKEAGLGITVHAGETWIPENIEFAINKCHANRIGHGLAISNDPDLIPLLVENDICVESCLTSNLLTSSVGNIVEHPIAFFITNEIPFVLCTDNPSIHSRTLSHEYCIFDEVFDDKGIIESMYKKQMKYAFANK